MSQPLLAEDIISRFAALERRLRALESSPQLTSASVKDGAITVYDASNVARVKIGKDGSDYDVKVYDAAGTNAVALSTLAFGIQAATILTLESVGSATYVDMTTAGPTVTVTIGPSGRAIVWLAAANQVTDNTAGNSNLGLMSFAVSGASTLAASDDRSVRLQADVAGGAGQLIVDASVGTCLLVTGLTAGSNTFTAKYRSVSGASVAWFRNRTIVVQPF